MNSPLQISVFCAPFSRVPKAWHQVQVDRDNQIRVYDDSIQKFTGLHSLSSNDTKDILAKATAIRVDAAYERLGAKIGLVPVPSDDELTWCSP